MDDDTAAAVAATSTSELASQPQRRMPWNNTATPAQANGHTSTSAAQTVYTPYTPPTLPSIQPTGPYPLAGISLRAFLLGLSLGTTGLLTLYLALISHSALWRGPFFLATLSTFHFLEYYVTARSNPTLAKIPAFLLSQNGYAYNVAHTLALAETLAGHGYLRQRGWYPDVMPAGWTPLILALGFGMIVVGQVVRSAAMVQAGTNFNHTVQWQRAKGHELVTSGIYAVLRHPSYFGFFWWGLGTQVVLGNALCFVGYAVILWKFFAARIRREEQYLVQFFGDDYVTYRKRTMVGIPFIR